MDACKKKVSVCRALSLSNEIIHDNAHNTSFNKVTEEKKARNKFEGAMKSLEEAVIKAEKEKEQLRGEVGNHSVVLRDPSAVHDY